MANYVVWNEIKIREFLSLAHLTSEQRKVFDDMLDPRISVIQTANALSVSERTVGTIRETIWKIYDEVQPYSPILTPRLVSRRRKQS
jgi:hypothetical protein